MSSVNQNLAQVQKAVDDIVGKHNDNSDNLGPDIDADEDERQCDEMVKDVHFWIGLCLGVEKVNNIISSK